MNDIVLAPVTRAQLPEVAAIHTRAFADSAITAFGLEAVRRYYEWLLDGPHDAALVGGWEERRLVGYCAAGVYRGAMSGFLRANRLYLAGQVAMHPRLLRSPIILDRLRSAVAITMRYSRFRKKSASSGAPRFGVLAIATDPRVRGSGVGRALMLDAEQRARGLGFPRMTLSVHPDNARAVKFYEQLGWKRAAGEGDWSGAMYKELSPT